MAKGGSTGLIARVGLGGPASDNGTQEVPFGETIQFLAKGVWDGVNSIAYEWTLAPTLSEGAIPGQVPGAKRFPEHLRLGGCLSALLLPIMPKSGRCA